MPKAAIKPHGLYRRRRDTCSCVLPVSQFRLHADFFKRLRRESTAVDVEFTFDDGHLTLTPSDDDALKERAI